MPQFNPDSLYTTLLVSWVEPLGDLGQYITAYKTKKSVFIELLSQRKIEKITVKFNEYCQNLKMMAGRRAVSAAAATLGIDVHQQLAIIISN